MPASGITPTLRPGPPLEQLIDFGPTTSEPVMPSPTTGSSSALISPTLNGQPETNGLGPLVDGPPGSDLNVSACVVGSIDWTFERSTTSTGNPATGDPSVPCHAYTWRSMPAAMTSGVPSPSRSAMTGEPRKPCWVRARLPLRTLTKGVSGLPEEF